MILFRRAFIKYSFNLHIPDMEAIAEIKPFGYGSLLVLKFYENKMFKVLIGYNWRYKDIMEIQNEISRLKDSLS